MIILILWRGENKTLTPDKTQIYCIFSGAPQAIKDAVKGMVFISGGQLCSPDLFKPVDTDKSEKCKPASCCPHLSFNVRGRGGPSLWDGNLMHINTGLHLWGSEGKTLRPSYRGWKGCAWIKSEAARAHGRVRAHEHAHTHRAESLIRGAGGYCGVSYRVGCFWAPHLWRLWSRCRRTCWVKWGYTPGWRKNSNMKEETKKEKNLLWFSFNSFFYHSFMIYWFLT